MVPVQATFLFSEISNKSFEVGQRQFALAPGQFGAQPGRFGEVDVVVRIFADAVGLFEPVWKSNVRVSKPKTPRARTPSTLALRRGGQNSK